MADETLKLLQHAVRKRGSNISSISPSAEDLCRIIDHWNTLHWEDRNRLTAEVKRLTDENKQIRARQARLEKDSA